MDDITLYVKAAPDGLSLGDCPFSQKVNLTLRFKQLDFGLQTIDVKNKPDWYLELSPGGTVPTLKVGDTVITDSDAAAHHVDGLTAEPRLGSADPAAAEANEGLFDTFMPWLKDVNADADSDLAAAYHAALERIDRTLSECDGPFYGGEAPSIDDLTLGPRLYHVENVARHHKGHATPDEYRAIHAFRARLHDTEEWQATVYPAEMVVATWGGWL